MPTTLATKTLAYAIVMTAKPGSRALDATAVAKVRAAVAPFYIVEDRTLAAAEAHELVIAAPETTDISDLRATLTTAVGAPAIDINIVANDLAFTRKKLLIADMESTIIEQEMLDELGDFIGKRAEIEDVTARAMRGELDFEDALNARVSLLSGLPVSVLNDVATRITLMPGAEILVRTMKANGAYCALVSGGFTVFTERIARRLGFDEHHANVLEINNGTLTGTVTRPILGRAAKRASLDQLITKLGICENQTLAVGDGANDLDMIAAAGLGIAFRAKPKVQAAANAMPNGAVVTKGDLTALLYLQGYTREQFATP